MVEVEGGQAVAENAGADGIEAAGDGLGEGAAPGAVGALDGAEAAFALEARVGALLAAVEQRRHEVAVTVDLEEAALFDLRAPFHAHPRLIVRIVALERLQLALQQRRAAFADNAAGPAAGVVIAAEVLREDLGGDQNLPDLEDGRDVFHKILCKIKQMWVILAAFSHKAFFGQNKNS